jgi:hypothetical protein
LFQSLLEYVEAASEGVAAFPKVSCSLELQILERLQRFDRLGDATTKTGHHVYYHNAPVHWGKVFDFVPMYRVDGGASSRSSHLKNMCFRTKEEAAFAICLLNSSLFYWFNWQFSNCRDLSLADVERAPARLRGTSPSAIRHFVPLCKSLMDDLRRHRKVYRRESKGTITEFDSFYPMYSKAVIDEIDTALGAHFGMERCEVEHIMFYDLKYRFGKGYENEDDE